MPGLTAETVRFLLVRKIRREPFANVLVFGLRSSLVKVDIVARKRNDVQLEPGLGLHADDSLPAGNRATSKNRTEFATRNSAGELRDICAVYCGKIHNAVEPGESERRLDNNRGTVSIANHEDNHTNENSIKICRHPRSGAGRLDQPCRARRHQ